MPKGIMALPMTKGEATKVVRDINAGARNLCKLLTELRNRLGWQALGYTSWAECCEKERTRLGSTCTKGERSMPRNPHTLEVENAVLRAALRHIIDLCRQSRKLENRGDRNTFRGIRLAVEHEATKALGGHDSAPNGTNRARAR